MEGGACRGAFVLILILLLLPLNSADPRDSEALLRIKDQLVAQSNETLSTWIIGSEPCTGPGWEGVNCTDGRVSALNLTAKGLVGVLPSEMGNLTLLETLELRNNSISGPIPPSFASLTNLKTLELSRNPLFGEFPNVILEMKSLLDIRLGNCNLTGPFPNIRELPSLRRLYLNSNHFEGGLPDLSNLPLSELSLWGTKLEPGWEAFGALVNLTFLSLHSCGLEGTLPIGWGNSLRKVESIILNDNDLVGNIPDSWSQMNQLMELRLDMNKLTGSIPSWLSRLNSVNVYLYCNYLSGGVLEGYPATNIKGNCFHTRDFEDHGSECNDGMNCQHGKKNKRIYVVVGGALGTLFILSAVAALLWKHKRAGGQETGNLKCLKIPDGIEKFSLRQLHKATQGFSKHCLMGCEDKLYSGSFCDGRIVTIQRVRLGSVWEFQSRISFLSRLRHQNIARLIGFCHEAQHQILVYEFMEKGNLEKWLFESSDNIDWHKRLPIAIGVAEGLEYLHSFSDSPVIHRNLKLSNIMLNGALVPKLLNYGLLTPELTTSTANINGYLGPEYFIHNKLSAASDVFSFGVVLLELITGQKAFDHTRLEEPNLVDWVQAKLASDNIHTIIDPRLGCDYPKAVLQALVMLTMNCVAFQRLKRPTMQTVLVTLRSLKTK